MLEEIRKLKPGVYRNGMRVDGYERELDLVATMRIGEDGIEVTDFEVKDNPYRFGKNCLGMHVYGAKVVRPITLASCDVTQAA